MKKNIKNEDSSKLRKNVFQLSSISVFLRFFVFQVQVVPILSYYSASKYSSIWGKHWSSQVVILLFSHLPSIRPLTNCPSNVATMALQTIVVNSRRKIFGTIRTVTTYSRKNASTLVPPNLRRNESTFYQVPNSPP